MRREARTRAKGRSPSPDEYRQFAAESVRRCLDMPINRKRGRAVQLILAKAWAKLADQAEEWRARDPPSAA
jgi:hypothetical protein